MKSITIQAWEKLERNPPESYKEFFTEERKFLEKNILKDSIVLDVGCGDGRMIKFFSKICKKVINIDNDKNAFEKCKENSKQLNNVEIFLEDAENMHFQDKELDVVCCIGTFCNFGETKHKILLEMKRVLKENGILIITIYNENALEERLKIYEKYTPGEFINKGNGTILYKNGVISEQFSEEQIRKILREASFDVEEVIKGGIFYLVKCRKEK